MRTTFVFFCLFTVALVQNAEINLKGFEGRDVLFRCSHRLAVKNNKYFCSEPCTSGDVLATVASGHRAVFGRITLMDLGNGAFDVNISHLQLSDSSLYRCGVDRLRFNTYTSVNLTVHKDPITTVTPDVSSTWTQNNSTLLSNGVKTTTNVTNGDEQKISPNIVLLAAAATGTTLVILMLATTLSRKCSELSKPQSQARSSCRDPDTAVNAKETDCVINEINWEKIFSPVSEDQDPNTDGGASRVYENVGFTNDNEGATNPTVDQQNQDASSRIYITLLPPGSWSGQEMRLVIDTSVRGCSSLVKILSHPGHGKFKTDQDKNNWTLFVTEDVLLLIQGAFSIQRAVRVGFRL